VTAFRSEIRNAFFVWHAAEFTHPDYATLVDPLSGYAAKRAGGGKKYKKNPLFAQQRGVTSEAKSG
jgi:hypothetical protein